MAAKKDVFSIRIDDFLFKNISELTEFFNEELLKNKISRNNLLENAIVKGIKYYYKMAEEHCRNARQQEKLKKIQCEFDEYLLDNFKEYKKENKTICIDAYYHELLKAYCRFENNIYNRDWSVNGLIIGSVINGILFYIQTDRQFITNMNIQIEEYNYEFLMDEITIITKKQYLKMEFR